MKRKIYLIIVFLWSFLLANAQDTLTVLQYNLLQYGNFQGYGGCSESTNNTQLKDECIRTILDYVKPDIFTVCEFGATAKLQSDFLRHNLNLSGKDYWQSDNIINYAGSNIINHIFYNSRKLGLKKHVALRTHPRDTDVYELYLKTNTLAVGDTVKLVCIVTHPKAGEEYAGSRYTLMQTVMNYVSQNYATENVLIMGDFNMYGASESGYQVLTRTYSNTNALFTDPLANLGGVGEWNNSYQFARFHTQSTRNGNTTCFSDGGLDDRFDFILMADEIKYSYKHLRYVPNSYKAIGNDGYHFNQSINQGYNYVVPAEVTQALFDCSDHLPVTMKIFTDVPGLGVDESEVTTLEASVAPNPASDVTMVNFFNPSAGLVQFELYSLQGQLVQRQSEHFGNGAQQVELDLQDVSQGFYLLRIRHQKGWRQTIKLIVR